MILKLDSDLPFSGLVPDEGMLEQLLSGWPAGVCLDETALYKVDELFGPGRKGKFKRNMAGRNGKVDTIFFLHLCAF